MLAHVLNETVFTPLATKPVPRQIILGLHGVAQAGKDTIANFLTRKYGFRRIAFADPLKDGASALFQVERWRFDDEHAKEHKLPVWDLSPREMIQILGTEGFTQPVHEDYTMMPVKQAAAALFGVPLYKFEDPKYLHKTIDHWNLCPEEMLPMVNLGGLRDRVREDFLIHRARLEIDKLSLCFQAVPNGTPPRFVFSDVRFINEAEFIKDEMEGLLWHIIRPINTHTMTEFSTKHRSERVLPSYLFNQTIFNTHSITQLEAIADIHIQALL